MSKASEIRALDAAGKSVAEIAEIVGCSREYVRVAARQRKDGCSRADMKFAPKKAARDKLCRSLGDRSAAVQAARRAYRKARESGDTSDRANSKYGSAYDHALVKSGRAFLRSDTGDTA